MRNKFNITINGIYKNCFTIEPFMKMIYSIIKKKKKKKNNFYLQYQ